MITLFTETFNDFLARNENSTEWQKIVDKINMFPHFTLGELDFDMYTLIKEKFGIREIGDETESIFVFEFNEKLNELLIAYKPKIEMYIANFANVLERKLSLHSSGDTGNYLYPIATQNGKLATNVDFKQDKETALFIIKSNAEILEQAMNLKNIYLDCLQGFEVCFMTIY